MSIVGRILRKIHQCKLHSSSFGMAHFTTIVDRANTFRQAAIYGKKTENRRFKPQTSDIHLVFNRMRDMQQRAAYEVPKSGVCSTVLYIQHIPDFPLTFSCA